jgi:hypothetical protein
MEPINLEPLTLTSEQISVNEVSIATDTGLYKSPPTSPRLSGVVVHRQNELGVIDTAYITLNTDISGYHWGNQSHYVNQGALSTNDAEGINVVV